MFRRGCRVKYKAGCIVIENDGSVMKICANGEISNDIDVAHCKVNGLFNSLRRYFRDYLPGSLELKKLDGYEFVADGGWVIIKGGGSWNGVGIDSASITFSNGNLNFWCKRVRLYEFVAMTLEKFVNELYVGEIRQDVRAINSGNGIILESWHGNVLEFDESSVRILQDFCVVFGEIKNPSEFVGWVSNISSKMRYQGFFETADGKEVHVFRSGLWKAEFGRDGKLLTMGWSDKEISIVISDLEVKISRKSKRRAFDLVGTFEKEDQISEIFWENNKILRSLVF